MQCTVNMKSNRLHLNQISSRSSCRTPCATSCLHSRAATVSRSSLKCFASQQRQNPGKTVAAGVHRMLQKYDFLSTGMGAVCVTGYFWAHGQPPMEALGITLSSTVFALVVNEVFFGSECQGPMQ